VPTVPGRLAGSADDAVDAASMLGYPVVLKRRRHTLPEPSARSALALDLRDAGQLREAAAALERRQTARQPSEGLGFLVQRQVGRARELLIRVGEDAVFGPTIAFGAGGSAAEILHDVAIDLPPLNLTLAHALIGRSRVAATLGQLHDFPAANREAIAETLVRISQLVVDFPEIAALDLNPLFVDARGVLAADAWIRLRGADEGPARLAIPPYPVELISHVETKGERFTLRPIRPEDAERHGAFFRRLSPQDIRYRFFSAMREMSAEQMARLTQVDYEREMAFLAVREATGETVGVARLVGEVGRGEGEFAVIVEPDMKGRGLARALMQKLIDWGATQGMTEIVGQVLADNQPMLAFVRGLGFTVRRVPGESDIVEARLALAA
jgi:acetyltransferase